MFDKGRATAIGKQGEYHYNCLLDQHLLNYLGLDPDALMAEIKAGKGDGELLEWVLANAKHNRAAREIDRWSRFQDKRGQDGDAETLQFFAETVGSFSKTRRDIKGWFDLLDLDDHVTLKHAIVPMDGPLGIANMARSERQNERIHLHLSDPALRRLFAEGFLSASVATLGQALEVGITSSQSTTIPATPPRIGSSTNPSSPSLRGCFRPAIKKFFETHRSFINQANNTHGLGVRSQLRQGKDQPRGYPGTG